MRAILCFVFLTASIGTGAQTIKLDQYPLRAGCSDDAEPLARLKKGDPVKIRFALAVSGNPCYSVTVEVDGQKVQGYVSADALTGLEEFDQARRRASAAALPRITRSQVEAVRQSAKENKTDYALAAEVYRAADALQAGRAAEAEQILAKAAAPRGNRNAAAVRAAALLDLNQPDRALEILQPALRENKKDPQLLALAGTASYQLDYVADALAYWTESLEVRPDPAVEEMLRKLEREKAADKSVHKSYGTRFLLRYEGEVADPELARSMVAVLEEEFSRVSFYLGCRADQRIVTIVQSLDAYRKATGAAEWNAGQYDGRIRVPLARSRQVDPATRRTFAHEIVHACMASLGRWPTWLHEGMAQKLSGEAMSSGRREALKTLARAGKLPKLEALGQGWYRLDAEQAALNYALALAAFDLFFQRYGPDSARNLMNNPENLPRLTAELDRALEESLSLP